MWALALSWCAVLLTSGCAFVACVAAQRAASLSLQSADIRSRVATLETTSDRTIEMQRKLAVRLNLEEGKRENPPQPRKQSNDEPSWQTDPEAFIRKHTPKFGRRTNGD